MPKTIEPIQAEQLSGEPIKIIADMNTITLAVYENPAKYSLYYMEYPEARRLATAILAYDALHDLAVVQ